LEKDLKDLEKRVTLLEERVENLHAFSVQIKMPEKVVVSSGGDILDTSGMEKRLGILETELSELRNRAAKVVTEI